MSNDENSPQTVGSFAHEMEAGMLVNELRRRGIQARACGADVAGFRAEAPATIDVVVKSQDYPQAFQIYSELQKAGTDVDWSQVDVGSPGDQKT